jgi:Txe/YoeB family toxin of Txe-Axe toxin-antitoxin module
LSERLAREGELRAQAELRAASLEKQLAQGPAQKPAPLPAPLEELPSDEEAQTFLLPVLTREFYDSIDRWSRRMQRAAFDKIHRLAGDWRHGSLRALALEGLPGYYRIRVATDVRLIYRREGTQLEILSLIDREDLDRYIRQARTRSGG